MKFVDVKNDVAFRTKGIPLSMIAEITGLDEAKISQIVQNQ